MQAFGHDHEYGVPLVVSGQVKDRVNKLKSLGNAVVPQIPYQIFLAIDAADG